MPNELNMSEAHLNHLNEIGDNDPVFIKELIQLFYKSVSESCDKFILSQSLREKQLIGHKLKSNFLLLGFPKCEEIADSIEHCSDPIEMNDQFSKLKAMLPIIFHQLSLYK